MNDIAELVSLALTFPTIMVGLGVLVHWGKDAWEAFKVSPAERTGVNWLILGVAVGFLGSVLDNAYWGLAWSAEYMQHPSKEFWFANGVWPNIPFRQCAGVYAAYCHMRSYYVSRKTDNTKLSRIVLASFAVGVVYVALATWARGSL